MSRSRRLPFLPDEVAGELGWTPYGWLFYLPSFWVGPALRGASSAEWLATILATGVFLVLYFRGYWERGWRLVAISGAIAGIGFLFFPGDWGAMVFFVYAGAFLGTLEPPRRAVTYLGVLGLLISAQIAWLDLPWVLAVPAVGVTFLIGGTNIHLVENARKNADLRRAHDEIERLAKVAERERIGRDLHDLLGHTLSVIVLKSELAAKLADRDPGRASREIREVEEISRQALREVRHAVRGFRADGGGGLADEVANACRVLGAAGIEPEIAFDGDGTDVSPAVERAAALAVREAVTNVIRHADADRCRVRIEERPPWLVVEIRDDGRGGEIEEGTGLRGMRERVEALGGTVTRTTDGGTRLRVRLPVSSPDEEVTA